MTDRTNLPRFVVVSGGIGVGKSTLLPFLASELGVRPFPELPDDNPYFGDESRALACQQWFLRASIRDAATAATHGGVLERMPLEHVEIFARLQRDAGRLSTDDFASLHAEALRSSVELRAPDCVIVVDASLDVALGRIRHRHNQAEAAITLDDLNIISSLYDRLLASWAHSPVIRIRSDTGAGPARVAESALFSLREVLHEASGGHSP